MAMRLFTEAEFHKELRKIGLVPTDERTDFHTIWIDDHNQPVTIPCDRINYPDYLLEELLCYLGLKDGQASLISETSYDVKAEHIPALKVVE